MSKLKALLSAVGLAALLFLPAGAVAQTPAKTTGTTATQSTTPTAAQIADAKAKGLVWCNKNTKVYHLSDSKYYGTTKNGAFMTAADAQKAGYKQAQDNPSKKKTSATAPNTTPSK